MDVRLPDGTIVTNVPEGITQAEVMRRLQQAETARNSTPEAQAESVLNSGVYEDMPWYQKGAVQLGAGMNNLLLGAKQLVATGDRAKQLEKEAKFTRLVNQGLAEKSDMGVGPSWAPTLGKTMQVLGEAGPMMAVPAGGFVRGATALPRAMGLMRAAPAAARLGGAALVGDAALSGAVSGALAPTVEGESRTWNALTGAGMSAAFPAATAGVNSIRRITTAGGGRTRAGEEIADAIAEGAGDQQSVLRQTIDRLRQTQGQQGPIPLSAAAQLADPQLARLEAGSRARNGANWYDFDQNQARAVADEFRGATAEAEQLASRRGTRSANWNSNWERAANAADPRVFMQEMGGFSQRIDDLLHSPEAENPAVRSVLQQVKASITDGSRPFTPAHLQQIRANLSGKVKPLSQNPFDTVPRDNPAIRRLLGDVDQVLNSTTGNEWSNVLRGYTADSRLVDASAGAGRARGRFYDQNTGRVLGVSADAAGDIPKITEAGLGQSMNLARGRLSDPANQRLESVLEALRAQNIVQGVKRSATAGGGSNTASDMFAARAAAEAGDAVAGMAGGPAGVVAKGLVDRAKSWANANRDAALAEALQDPNRLMQILERRLAAGEPLSPAESGVLQILRGAPLAASMTMGSP